MHRTTRQTNKLIERERRTQSHSHTHIYSATHICFFSSRHSSSYPLLRSLTCIERLDRTNLYRERRRESHSHTHTHSVTHNRPFTLNGNQVATHQPIKSHQASIKSKQHTHRALSHQAAAGRKAVGNTSLPLYFLPARISSPLEPLRNCFTRNLTPPNQPRERCASLILTPFIHQLRGTSTRQD